MSSGYRSLRMPAIVRQRQILHPSRRSHVKRLLWASPRLVASSCPLTQPSVESHVSSLGQNHSIQISFPRWCKKWGLRVKYKQEEKVDIPFVRIFVIRWHRHVRPHVKGPVGSQTILDPHERRIMQYLKRKIFFFS